LSEIKVIQFITGRHRILIPGGGVSVVGQTLEIGPGKSDLAYHSPDKQIEFFGVQVYKLVGCYDSETLEERKHKDLDVGPSGKVPVMDVPAGNHRELEDRFGSMKFTHPEEGPGDKEPSTPARFASDDDETENKKSESKNTDEDKPKKKKKKKKAKVDSSK